MEPAGCVSSSSVSDGVKCSQALHSAATKTNSSSQQPSNLPPRLQKKQRKAEEENYMKYYKPMDYMRQTNSYHRKVDADTAAQQARQHSTGSARRVCDVNSRGSVTNRTLWTDDMPSVTSDRSSTAENASVNGPLQSNMKTSFHQSNINAADTVCEQKPPVAILTSSSHKQASLEASVASLNIQSTSSKHMTSQPSVLSVRVSHVILWLLFVYYKLCKSYQTECHI